MTRQAGAYILQWKCFDCGRGSFDLRSAHKSKIMYYTEVLQSDKFKYVSDLELVNVVALNGFFWARERCRISPPRFLVECLK